MRPYPGTRSASRRWCAIALVAAVVIASDRRLVARSTAGTSAAWTNQAYLVAPGELGVVDGTGWDGRGGLVEAPHAPAPPPRTCTVTTVRYADFGDGRPDGSRRARIYFNRCRCRGQ